MKEQDRIPTTKMHRAGRFVATGAKIGTNYLKHYGKKLINSSLSKEELHNDNATDIYESLSQLKGSALKVAQMLSMDKNLLPTAYQQQFAMAQYSAPPLSYPLVIKTFEQQLGRKPTELFESFSSSAINAASMGQVHQASLKGKKLGIKIQYPGVADTIKSDLAMIKPIALRMFKINPTDYNEFIQEVQQRLLEEADYSLELKRSMELSQKCSDLENVVFPRYYPEWSSAKVLTMDWVEGEPLGEFLKNGNGSMQENQRIGQALWDFYHYQIHQLRALHADPHPGNFIITPEKKLGVIDFGCVKVIPPEFYQSYFKLLDRRILTDKALQERTFKELHFIYPDDSEKEKRFFSKMFLRLVELLGKPFSKNTFDFSDKKYFEELFKFGAEISMMKEFRESTRARGVRDALYINRTYYGLYNILHELNAKVDTSRFPSQV